MIYCDSSLLVAILTTESFSERCRDWMDEQPAGSLSISWWTDPEIASALALKQRTGALSDQQWHQVRRQWMVIRPDFLLAEVRNHHFIMAAALIEASDGLRAGDALHLAIVREHGWMLATLDQTFSKAARESGVHVVTIST